MAKKNLLIFPAGTEIAFEIFNALKYSKFVRIFGGTSADDHSEFVFKNLIKEFPFVNDGGFLDFLNSVIDEYKIDCVYPAHDSVGVFMSKNRNLIHAQVIICDYETVRICRSKSETYKYFADTNFVPKYYKTSDEVDKFPVFVKPDAAQGSQGAKKINSREELCTALEKDNTAIICEYLPGVEYTVDCFTDRHGSLRAYKLRDRERIRAGISVRSMKLPADEKIKNIASMLNQKLSFRGAWFFQVKKNMDGEYRLLEVSPRIPGTMGASRNQGINYPMLTLFDFWDFDVNIIDNDYELLVDRAFYSAYKLGIEYEDIYLDFDDTVTLDGKVNADLIRFIYQAKNKEKRIHLLSRHNKDIYKSLERYHICADLFDDINVIGENENKCDYIHGEKSIFIDDSFAERKSVKDHLGIPVFDVDMIEALIDWRM